MTLGCRFSGATENPTDKQKFDKALKIVPQKSRGDSLALIGNRYCNNLFALEREFESLSPQQQLERRMKFSRPLMEAFFAWAYSCGVLPKSAVGKAVFHAISQRKYLENICWAAG